MVTIFKAGLFRVKNREFMSKAIQIHDILTKQRELVILQTWPSTIQLKVELLYSKNSMIV